MKVTETIKMYLNNLNERAKAPPVPNNFCWIFKNKNLCCILYKTMTVPGK